MTVDQKIYAAVKEAQDLGMTTGATIFPMLNMIATLMANAVVHNNLNPEEELEPVRHQLDELFTKYLLAYRKQGVPTT